MIDLHCDDCINTLRSLDDNCVDLIVTDPPYALIGDGGHGCFEKETQKKNKELKQLMDGISNEVLEEMCRVMKKINIYLWCSKNQLRQFIDFFDDKGCAINLLTWHKDNAMPAVNGIYMNDTEYCVYARESGAYLGGTAKTKCKYYVTHLNQNDKKIYEHPTIKPLFIIKNLVFNSSREGETVMDCYMGSGTTGVACVDLKRNFIGCEIDKKFFDIAKIRIDAEMQQGKLF